MTLSSLVRATAAVLLATTPLLAQSPGEQVEGTLLHVELRDTPRHIKVRWSGGEVQQTIANRTRVVFDTDASAFPNSELSDLQPGMQVKFNYSEGVLDRLRVVGIPPNLLPHHQPDRAERREQKVERREERAERREDRREAGAERGGRREMKVRILSIDERRGEFRADFQGRRESFRMQNPRLLSRFEVEEMVIIVVEPRGGEELVTDIRSASKTGRVVDVDRRRREVVLNVDGRDEVYRVEDTRLLEDVRTGDRIRFEFEERSSGRSVITYIH